MPLTHSQKKYIKKNIRMLSSVEIAANLKVSEKEILDYLKSQWRKEKYQKFLQKEGVKTYYQEETIPEVQAKDEKEPFRFWQWLSKNWKIFVFMAFLVSVSYFNSLKNDFVSDDITAIRDNPLIDQVNYFWQPSNFNFFSPRALIIFITHRFWGLEPLFYRLSNILPHLGSTILIYFLIRRFSTSPIPLITASIFAVHPILTEGVAWISGGPYSNGAFFALLSFLIYLQTKDTKFRFFLSIPFFLVSVLFTEKFIIFPLVLILYEFSLGSLRSQWRKLIPFFIISGFFLINLLGRLGSRVSVIANVSYQEPGVNNPLIQIPIAVSSYLKLIFWPQNLALYHSEEAIYTQGEYIFNLVIFLFFFGLIIYFFKKEPRIFFWLSFFLITLLPTLTPFLVADVIAERYVYFGSLGIFVFIAFLIQKIGALFENQKINKFVPDGISYLILIFILAVLTTRTILRNMDWRNSDTLSLAMAKTSPSSPQNHNNLGGLYARENNWEKAIEEFKMAIELEPKFATAYQNLAIAYYEIKKYDLAVENYQKALDLDPNLWQSAHDLGTIYASAGKLDLAIEYVEKAISVNPENANSYGVLGMIYLQKGEKERAKEYLKKALELNPENEETKRLLLQAEN